MSKPTGVNTAAGETGGGGGVGAGGGTVWQPAAMAPTIAINRKRSERTMGWIYLEAGLALLVFVGIVAWTMAARRKPDAEASRDDEPR